MHVVSILISFLGEHECKFYAKPAQYVTDAIQTIHIYDMASSKWYTQTASGTAPPTRRQFCADVTWPDDKSSYNM